MEFQDGQREIPRFARAYRNPAPVVSRLCRTNDDPMLSLFLPLSSLTQPLHYTEASMELHQRLRRLSTRSSARRHGQRADIPAQQDPPISAAVPSSPGIPDGTLEETALPTPTSSHGTITETVSETFKARPVHIILRIIPTPSSAPVHDQLQSPFFSKLPPEIRLMIYEYALGDTRTVIHLAHKRDGSIQAVFDYDLNDQFAGSHGCLAMDRMRPADLDPSSIGGSFLDDEKEDCTELVKKSRASSDPAFQFLQTCQRV